MLRVGDEIIEINGQNVVRQCVARVSTFDVMIAKQVGWRLRHVSMFLKSCQSPLRLTLKLSVRSVICMSQHL